MPNTATLLRFNALSEGVSWLLLLFFAMPMKYMLDQPIYVTYIGMAHGALFVSLMALLVLAQKVPWGIRAQVFIASFIPFAPFVIDKKLKPYQG